MSIPLPEAPLQSLNLQKGSSDWRDYRSFTLPNSLTCLVVSDTQSKSTACSVCVNVGAASDPRQLSGLAHFTEHMCFLGSAKYPGENEYKKYLASHGGSSNASTSMHATTYKFDVLAEHAEKAVDIFSGFFVEPLFSKSGTKREVNAVDSENSKNMSNDTRRRLQILKAIAEPGHYYSKFSTGHKNSLGHGDDNEETQEQVREALLSFHRRHYRPKNMVCVIVGPQSLDQLQEWITTRFADIPDHWAGREKKILEGNTNDALTPVEAMINEAAQDAPDTNKVATSSCPTSKLPFNPAFSSKIQNNQWPINLTTKPLRSMRKLYLSFPVPSPQSVPNSSPVTILSHLLGHEGPNSPFAVLQDAGLIQSLSAGLRVSAPDQALFQIDVGLTEEGEERWRDIVTVVLEHCTLITNLANEAAVQLEKGNDNNEALEELQRVWNEIVQIRSIKFHQTSPSSAYVSAPSFAQGITTYGVQNCLTAGRILEKELPLEYLRDFTSRILPENCFVEHCSPNAWKRVMELEQEEKKDDDNFGLQKEQWYGIDYHLAPISQKDVDRWNNITATSGSMDITSYLSSVKGVGCLRLPEPNQFIPRTLELCPDLPDEAKLGPRIEKDIDPPNLILQEEGFGRLWHRLDDRYALPKSNLVLLFRNAAIEHVLQKNGHWKYDTDAAEKSLLLEIIFSEALTQEMYAAGIAGVYWAMSASTDGLTLRCNGFSDRVSHLALRVLKKFQDCDSFITERFVASAKDRLSRAYRSYLKSTRADSQSSYYKRLLLSSHGLGVEAALTSVENVSLESLKQHHRVILSNKATFMECFYTGNVGKQDALDFFQSAKEIVQNNNHKDGNESNAPEEKIDLANMWVPGGIERRLNPGEHIELHINSENDEEQNGAMHMVFQSPIGGFKGEGLSKEENLKSSASIRLLCHILKEPLFDELRTKQQIGYVVSSYYDLNFAAEQQSMASPANDSSETNDYQPWSTPVNSIVINILSKKLSPIEVANRVDDFLLNFRQSIENMPSSEISEHKTSLSKKLKKPIQKLDSEASLHFGRIRRYAPEIFSNGGSEYDIPWKSVLPLADCIEGLDRSDLLTTWDSTVAHATSRSRLVSCVYGKTFPFNEAALQDRKKQAEHFRKPIILRSMEDIIQSRQTLTPFCRNSVMNYSTTSKQFVARALGLGSMALEVGLCALRRQGDHKGSTK